ncbi:MAG: hypothetical protein GXX96_38945 [Planctomycetaceae bacterium]|nr:hypothetical protein [Planctomycetaceae bacterium]
MTPTPYQEVQALLHSDALRAVEQAIASETGSRIVEDYSTACTTYTQADMSVSGMTVGETEALLLAKRDQIVRFGIAFLRDQAAADDSEEYPEGEEQDPSETVEVHGLGVGFGVKYAIFYNFLVHRTPAELLAYLKNRRIPHHTRFAQELRRLFDAVREGDA